MSVYDLHNPQHLENDLNNIISRLNEMYFINIEKRPFEIFPRLTDTSGTFWASAENNTEFNKLVPLFKNLHKDMYAFIESFSSLATGKKYDYTTFEIKYENYREFRLMNNMFKHPNRKDLSITLTKVCYLEQKQYDLMCNFHFPNGTFKCIGYAQFIQLFLTILVDWKAIKWKKMAI